MPLWTCPNGCGSVRGGKRPRRNDLCRYCIPCSQKAGQLVERAAAAAPKQKKRRKVKMKPPSTGFLDGRRAGSWLLYHDMNVLVRQSMRRRPSIIDVKAKTLTVYEFDGDEFDRRATVIMAEQRYYAARAGVSGQAMKTYIRRNLETAIGVRLRLESMRKAEEELAERLRAKAALKVLENANTLDRRTAS
jgi:hypothetical protein